MTTSAETDLKAENAELKESIKKLQAANDEMRQELEELKAWPDHGESVAGFD